MSALYRSGSPARVTHGKLVARTPIARVVYLHLMFGEIAGQVPGIVRAGVLALAEDVGLEPAVVRDALSELLQHGLVEVDAAARLIRLPGVPSDFVRAATVPLAQWMDALNGLPESPLKEQHRREIIEAFPAAAAPGWVYFIQAGGDGPIKIGFSLSPATRLAQLQTSMPDRLRLLAQRTGSRADERDLHKAFQVHRIRGEWFAPHQDLLDYIAATKEVR